jgi:ABC-type transport system involved in cytochrome c biogenesis permease component
MWPIILRELRAGSRRWTTYWLRLLGASAIVIAIFFWFMEPTASPNAGSELFAVMHRIVFGGIWVIAPLLACDCLSQERREGTLGLLFLTNLKARDIVIAKVFSHGLRSLTMWAATLPIIAVPLLLGGIHWKEVVLSVGLMLGAVSLGTAAGIAASSTSVGVSRSTASALCLSGLFFLCFFALLVLGAFAFVTWVFVRPAPASPVPLHELVNFASGIGFNIDGLWNELFSSRFVGLRQENFILAGVFAVAAICFGLLAGVIILSAWHIRRHWQDKPKTKRQAEVESFFCTPVFWKGAFRKWMRRSLERNPIGWLEKRRWSGRVTAWIWFSIMISFASTAVSLTSFYRGDGASMLNALMWLLLISMAYVAAGSFRRERETGALELIVVTPLSEREIIFGRLRGLWGHFLPAFAVWVAVVLYISWVLRTWTTEEGWHWFTLLQFVVYYAIVPILGLYFSLRSRFVLLAWAGTIATGYVLPYLVWWIFYYFLAQMTDNSSWGGLVASMGPVNWFLMLFTQLTIAAFLLWRLHVNLVRRSFSFR